MSKRKDIPESDSELFRKTVGKVERIKNDHVVHVRKKPSATLAGRLQHDQSNNHISQHPAFLSDVGGADRLYFKRPGIQQKLMLKLRRGLYRIESQIDLHGFSAAVAEKSLDSFLESCRQNNYRCIRIIHGKGTGSANKRPVIKNRINEWLRGNGNVLAFCSAKANDGGTGALYVLLRTRR